jgi:hypothetical protein
MTHFSMRSRIESKKNHVTGLLFKIEIAPALTFSIQTSHFNNAMHGFALVLCMPPVCDLCPEFKESGICVHTLVGQEKKGQSVRPDSILKSKFLDRFKTLLLVMLFRRI